MQIKKDLMKHLVLFADKSCISLVIVHSKGIPL